MQQKLLLAASTALNVGFAAAPAWRLHYSRWQLPGQCSRSSCQQRRLLLWPLLLQPVCHSCLERWRI
jgi:hypothetical protein